MTVQLETLSQSQGIRRNTVEFVGVTDGEFTVSLSTLTCCLYSSLLSLDSLIPNSYLIINTDEYYTDENLEMLEVGY